MNIDYLQEQLDKLKIDLEKAVQGALNVVVEQKRAEVTSYNILSYILTTYYHNHCKVLIEESKNSK